MACKATVKQCVICGEDYRTTKGPAKYCPACRKAVQKKQSKEWHEAMRRKRGDAPAVSIEEAVRMSMATGKTYGQLQREGKI